MHHLLPARLSPARLLPLAALLAVCMPAPAQPPGPVAASVAAPASAPAEAAGPPPAPAGAPATELRPVLVEGHYDNGLGSADAASQGRVTAALIASRPTLRPAEVLEFVPGVIVTQHSGDGKANQYFLRGFNLDHGTDFATFVAGMPVNMPSHAHGQGYSDLNWLIPELVSRIDYRKGPYAAEEGDFASAGSARIGLVDALPRGVASLTLGAHAYERALLADSLALGPGRLLFAVEAAHNDGPWENPEKFHRQGGVLRYSVGDPDARTAVTAMAYAAGWNATDQVPQRAVDAGLVGRFGAIDPTDGGQTSRYSLSVEHVHRDDRGEARFNAYLIQSTLDLFSDFTYNLDRPSPRNADQFEQAEHRRVYGANLSRSIEGRFAGRESVATFGVQLRQDRLDPVGLYASIARQRVGTTQESTVRETSVGLFAEAATTWTPWLRTVAGLRWDHVGFDVASSIAGNSGNRSAALASPKLSMVLGPWARSEIFLNYGQGFHSNDARGVNETVTPKEMAPAEPSPGLVRSKGGELGLRTEWLPGLQSSIALWQLRLASELVFSGDAGDTEASGASTRRGIEFNQHYVASRWLLLDADVALSQARFDTPQGVVPHLGRSIPGAVDRVASFGATVTDLGRWSGHLQLRYFGPRPLIEDASQRSAATTLAYLRVGYRLGPDLRLAVDVFNLFDRRASDIDYYYASRLPGEPAGGVDDIHGHPVEPRSLRLTLTANF